MPSLIKVNQTGNFGRFYNFILWYLVSCKMVVLASKIVSIIHTGSENNFYCFCNCRNCQFLLLGNIWRLTHVQYYHNKQKLRKNWGKDKARFSDQIEYFLWLFFVFICNFLFILCVFVKIYQVWGSQILAFYKKLWEMPQLIS